MRSVVNASEPLPVSERRMASGTSSAGKPVAAASGRSADGQQLHRARAAEHADGDENPDQERDDLHGDVESFLRAVDEDVVDLDLADQAGERDEDEQHRNRPERDRLERGADHELASAGAAGCG